MQSCSNVGSFPVFECWTAYTPFVTVPLSHWANQVDKVSFSHTFPIFLPSSFCLFFFFFISFSEIIGFSWQLAIAPTYRNFQTLGELLLDPLAHSSNFKQLFTIITYWALLKLHKPQTSYSTENHWSIQVGLLEWHQIALPGPVSSFIQLTNN